MLFLFCYYKSMIIYSRKPSWSNSHHGAWLCRRPQWPGATWCLNIGSVHTKCIALINRPTRSLFPHMYTDFYTSIIARVTSVNVTYFNWLLFKLCWLKMTLIIKKSVTYTYNFTCNKGPHLHSNETQNKYMMTKSTKL